MTLGASAAGTTLKGDVNRDGVVTEIQRIAAEFGPEKYLLDNIRNYVVGIDEPVELTDGTKRTMINFDNAATTPLLMPIKEEVDKELLMYGSIGRGFSQKSDSYSLCLKCFNGN